MIAIVDQAKEDGDTLGGVFEVIARLRTLGYGLSFVSLRGEVREGYGAAVRVDGKVATAGADPRRAGAAGAIK